MGGWDLNGGGSGMVGSVSCFLEGSGEGGVT